MRSVYAKILAWSLATLFISMTLFFVISRQIEMHLGAEVLFRNVQALELEQTVQAWQTGGTAGRGRFYRPFEPRVGMAGLRARFAGTRTRHGCEPFRSGGARWSGHWGQVLLNPGGLMFGTQTPDGRYTC